jgi:hypothetical protein
MLSPLHFDVAVFSLDVFFEPLAFWGCLFFYQRSFFLSPLHFEIISFFIGCLSFLSPLHYGVAYFFTGYLSFFSASFFIRDLYFEPMNEGCNNALSFMALAFLAYQVLSNTELAMLAISTMVINFLGNEAYIIVSGLNGLRLIKNLMPSWTSPVRKRLLTLRK